jgi:site-specific DNA-methyltransferase (adenine-specific)
MKDMPDKSIDLVVTSPPYDNLRDYGKDFNGFGEHIWKRCIKHISRILKDGGACVWIVNDATIKGSETGTSFKQALFAIECGLNLHDTMIWLKTGAGAVGSNLCYLQNFEYMFVWSKGRPKTINRIKDRKNIEKSSKQPTKSGRRADGTGGNKTGSTFTTEDYGFRFNTWIQSGSTHPIHKATFPEQIAIDHIKSWSTENDTVLDCFMGSGTTGVACKKLNRNFIGIELDADYFKIASDRIAKPVEQQLF